MIGGMVKRTATIRNLGCAHFYLPQLLAVVRFSGFNANGSYITTTDVDIEDFNSVSWQKWAIFFYVVSGFTEMGFLAIVIAYVMRPDKLVKGGTRGLEEWNYDLLIFASLYEDLILSICWCMPTTFASDKFFTIWFLWFITYKNISQHFTRRTSQ